MIKFRRGNTRIALILFNFLVIKFPNPRIDWHVHSFQSSKSFLSFLKKIPGKIYGALLYGIASNISEALIFHLTGPKAHYLAPTFTLAICNFQIYQGEEKPTQSEIRAVYQSLSPESQKWIWETDPHERSEHNWRKTKKGLILIDYGADPLRTAWAAFLRGSRNELNQATTKT